MAIDRIGRGRCVGCGACVAACPQRCLAMGFSDGEFPCPVLKRPDACINCARCINVCPIISVADHLENGGAPESYAVYNRDAEVRRQSTSGGVFSLVAAYVIAEGGVVYGATYSHDFHSVLHARTETEESIGAMRGSKYVQSQVGAELYRQLKEDTHAGRLVLFTGTPCQCAAVRAFVGEDDNLITLEVICHGVGSPGVFSAHQRRKEKDGLREIIGYSCRDKVKGWRRSCAYYYYYYYPQRGKKVVERGSAAEDSYLKGFYENLFLRESCHSCAFAKLPRNSDLTMADFWGIDKFDSSLNDGLGISSVLTNTERGRKIFNQVCKRGQCAVKAVPLEWITTVNKRLQTPSTPSALRDAFWTDFRDKGVEFALSRYCQPNVRTGSMFVRFARALLRRCIK